MINKNIVQYNIYCGKIPNIKYIFTKTFRSEDDALNTAKKYAESYYYKNEGKHGIPSFDQLSYESELTGVDIEILYAEHINDLMRWYVIPTECDTIPNRKLKF